MNIDTVYGVTARRAEKGLSLALRYRDKNQPAMKAVDTVPLGRRLVAI